MLVTEYDVGPGAYGVALAADGAVWTSLTGRGELVRVGPDGQVSQIRLDTGQSRPMVLARGPDDAIWFSRGDGRIGRTDPAGTASSVPVLTPGRLAVRVVCRPGPDALVHPADRGPDRPDQPGRRYRGVRAAGGQHALADHGRAGRRAVVHP